MEERDRTISVRQGRLTLPAQMRRQADLPDDAQLHVSLHEGAFVLYKEPPSFLRRGSEQPGGASSGPAPLGAPSAELDALGQTPTRLRWSYFESLVSRHEPPASRHESAVCGQQALMLRALESIPARDIDGFCGEALRLVMSDLRLMGAGITIFTRRWGVMHAAFTTLDGYLVHDPLVTLAPDARQIVGVTRRPAWIREPWRDPRVSRFGPAGLPRTSCFAAPVFTLDGFVALLFGFSRRVEAEQGGLVEDARKMAERLAISLHPHLSSTPSIRETWRPLNETVLCRDCAQWTPVGHSHRPAGATHHERYCEACWERRCGRRERFA